MNNVQNLVDFNILGIEKYLDDKDKQLFHNISQELQKCYKEKEELVKKKEENNNKINFTTASGLNLTRKKLNLDNYSLEEQKKILGQIAYFYNKENKKCKISEINEKNGSIYLSIIIAFDKTYNKETKLSLNRFLQLYEINDFKLVVKSPESKKFFKEVNLNKNIDNEIRLLDKRIENIKNSESFKRLMQAYSDKRNEVNKEYNIELNEERRDVEADKIRIERKQKILTDKIKNIKDVWKDTLTLSEQAETIGWICRHINKIVIKVVDGGVSDKVISRNYPDSIYGPKYKEKANSSGWDASAGYLFFDDVSKAPIDYLRRLSTAKHMFRTKDNGQTVFDGKKMSNLDLALFLLGNYNKYGFVSGKDHLNVDIDVVKLVEDNFPQNKKDFYKGYSPEDNVFEEE